VSGVVVVAVVVDVGIGDEVLVVLVVLVVFDAECVDEVVFTEVVLVVVFVVE
jgi:hypothetical protein